VHFSFLLGLPAIGTSGLLDLLEGGLGSEGLVKYRYCYSGRRGEWVSVDWLSAPLSQAARDVRLCGLPDSSGGLILFTL